VNTGVTGGFGDPARLRASVKACRRA